MNQSTPSTSSVPSPPGSRPGAFRRTCRPYTSVMLTVVGAVVGLVMALVFDIAWVYAAAITAAFWFGALVARPWCRIDRR